MPATPGLVQGPASPGYSLKRGLSGPTPALLNQNPDLTSDPGDLYVKDPAFCKGRWWKDCSPGQMHGSRSWLALREAPRPSRQYRNPVDV